MYQSLLQLQLIMNVVCLLTHWPIAQTLTTCTCAYPVRHFGSHNVHKGTDFKNGGNGRQVEVQCARGSFGNYLRLQQYNLVLKKGKCIQALEAQSILHKFNSIIV